MASGHSKPWLSPCHKKLATKTIKFLKNELMHMFKHTENFSQAEYCTDEDANCNEKLVCSAKCALQIERRYLQ